MNGNNHATKKTRLPGRNMFFLLWRLSWLTDPFSYGDNVRFFRLLHIGICDQNHKPNTAWGRPALMAIFAHSLRQWMAFPIPIGLGNRNIYSIR
jgi:hypothetical protein